MISSDNQHYTQNIQHTNRMIKIIKENIDNEIIDFEYFYESFTLKFIEEIKKANSYFDCGAEFGYYAYLAMKNMPIDSKIYLFEPEDIRYKALLENFKDKKVKIYPYAIIENNNNIKLFKEAPHRSSTIDKNFSQMDKESIKEVKSYICKGISLDNFLQQEKIDAPDIIKMDIEGAEIFAFEGMENILKRCKTKIFLEVHKQYIEALKKGGTEELTKIIKENNYDIYLCENLECKKIDYLASRVYLVPKNLAP